MPSESWRLVEAREPHMAIQKEMLARPEKLHMLVSSRYS